MVQVFNIFIYIHVFIAVVASLILFIILAPKQTTAFDNDAYNNTVKQIKTCKTGSFIFVVFSWLLSSGRPYLECITLYSKLSQICATVGYVWLGLAFLSVMISIIMGLSKRPKAAIEQVGKVRNSALLQAMLFLIVSFLLNLN